MIDVFQQCSTGGKFGPAEVAEGVKRTDREEFLDPAAGSLAVKSGVGKHRRDTVIVTETVILPAREALGNKKFSRLNASERS